MTSRPVDCQATCLLFYFFVNLYASNMMWKLEAFSCQTFAFVHLKQMIMERC
nr:MAG TPA: hypothetical protein [Caudoviricetes sp.]